MIHFTTETGEYIAVELYSNIVPYTYWVEADGKDNLLYFVRPLPPFSNVRRMKRLKGVSGKLAIIGRVGEMTDRQHHSMGYKIIENKEGFDQVGNNHLILKKISN